MFFERLFLVFAIAGAYLLIKWLAEQNKIHDVENISTLEIAQVNYIKGEITENITKNEPLLGMLT